MSAEVRLEQCKTVGDDERSCNSLESSCGNQNKNVGSKSAPEGAHREADEARSEYSCVRDSVAKRAAEQHQSAQGEQVTVHYPLQARHAESQVAANRRHCNHDDAAFEEYRSRPENRCDQYPSSI